MRSRRCIILVFLALVVLLFPVVEVAAERVLTPEMVADLQSVAEAQIDPTGHWIAFVRRSPRGAQEAPGGPYTELFLVRADRAETPRQYTYRPAGVRHIRWSPDGAWIAFLSRRKEFDEHTQVYRIPRDGGEARPVTRARSDVLTFAWSPDGRSIAYIAREPETEEEAKARKVGRDWNEVDGKYRQRRLYLQPVPEGKARELNIGDRSVWDMVWSPDGRYLFVQASPTPKTDDALVFRKLYRVPVDRGQPELLVETEGKLGSMAASPDGAWFAWSGAVDRYDPTAGSLFVIKAEGGKPRNLMLKYQGTVTHIAWLDNETLLFTAVESEHTVLKAVDVKSGRTRYLIGPEAGLNISSLSVNRRRGLLVLVADTFRHPREVFVGRLKGGVPQRWTHHNPGLDGLQFQPWEVFTYRARDGLTVRGLVLKPLGFESGQRYPVVVQVHGGPESAYTVGWQTSYGRWSHLLSHRGYLVFAPNYRASTGRGVDYAKADHGDLGDREFTDVLDGVKALAAKGWADPQRAGIGGGSYGGYFSALAATRYAGNFRAAVDFAGIADWLSMAGTSDIPWELSLVHFELRPPGLDPRVGLYFERAHRLKVLEWSPIWYIERAVQKPTALLIAHGERDARVPIQQGRELYQALKMAGHPRLAMVTYPREGHGLRERNHQVDFMYRVLNWFETHVKGGK